MALLLRACSCVAKISASVCRSSVFQPLVGPGHHSGQVVDQFLMEPSQSQPEEATWTLLHPADPPPMGRTAGVRCAAKRLALKAEGVEGLDPDGRGWFLLEEVTEVNAEGSGC